MKTVRLLALGTSLYEAKPNPEPGVDVFGLQYTWKSHKLHRAFIMDDRDWIVKKNNTVGRDIVKEINSYDFPVYTAKLWGDLNNNQEYPLEHVISCFPNLKHKILEKTEKGEEAKEVVGRYFMNTICYMIALAIFEEYERIELYGIDMENSAGRQRNETWEDERACVSYWLGVAVGRGIEVVISRGSRITKPNKQGDPKLYGYEISEALQVIRDNVLKNNKEMESVIHSGNVTQHGNDRIIDLTDKKIGLAFYHKEDFPVEVKAGDRVTPNKEPFYKTNDKLDQS